jgi:hypothetical protein
MPGEPVWKRHRAGRLGSHAPGAYWYGWMVRGENQEATRGIDQVAEREDVPVDIPVTTNDADAVREMEESAFVTTISYGADRPEPRQVIAKGPMEGLGGIDDDIAERLVTYYQEVYKDPAGWRQSKFETVRKDVLKKLKSIELNEAVTEARRVVEQTKQGITWAEDYRIEWEETIIETMGMEVPEDERLVTIAPARTPPPGPDPGGRGAFFICVDGCHLPGSLVPMADGTVKKIEEVVVGDTVKAFDGTTVVPGTVSAVFNHERVEYVEIMAGGNVLRVTSTHTLFVLDGERLVEKTAVRIKVGEKLLSLVGDGVVPVPVESINWFVGPVEVFDFEVKDYHNNFVGGILGHNSGSMGAGCGGGMSRYEVASAIVWTFIQEAKAINREGLSHYIGIYGCDHYFFYPVPQSEYPAQTPWNPLPCGDIFLVERDFLRYWPDMDGPLGRRFMGDNYWQLVLPILYEDYVKFGAGDFILIIDGDLRRDTMFLHGGAGGGSRDIDTLRFSGDAAEYYEPEWEMRIPKDRENPGILMKLQKYMKDNECGTGYVCWVIPEGRPDFSCPKCGSKWPGGIRYVGLSTKTEEFVMECLNPSCGLPRDGSDRRIYRDGYMKACGHCTTHGTASCLDCKYVYLVLGHMFKNGRNVFRGQSANEILENIAKTLHEQRIGRVIKRTGGEDIALQDGEDEYSD